MEEHALRKWLEERLARIRKHAGSVEPGFYPEPIHHLRTETKRLRALTRLIAESFDETPKLPGSFKRLYRIAGSVRDPQMHLLDMFGPRQPKVPMFSLWLARQMAPGIANWKRKFTDDILDELGSFCDKLSSHRPGLQQLVAYFKKRKKQIQELLDEGPDDEDLHQIRKFSKDMLYLLAFCESHWPEAWEKLRHLESILKRVSDRAGAFNDKRNMLDVSAQFLKDYEGQLEEKDLALAQAAIDRWTVQKEQTRKRLMASLRALLRRKVVRGSRSD